jgi:diadenosine tetraphosphate (Ap4A) HIT family hydrolase
MDKRCRVVLVSDEAFPGFCRAVWNDHVKEMTDLADADRIHLMDAVYATEAALRALLQPEKMNVASLGNQTPHLHWHVIPRFREDSHFPDPVWATARRTGTPRALPPDFSSRLTALIEARLGKQ